MMEKTNKSGQFGLFLLGLSVASGLAVGGYFVGQTMYNAKVALNTAEVKGLAERRVKADHAIWKINFTVSGASRDDIPILYKEAEKHQQSIMVILKDDGFTDAEINLGVLHYSYQEFRGEDKKLVDQTHKLTGTISVETNNVEMVSKTRSKMNKLIAQGIDIQNRKPSYKFTKLNTIKPEMLRDATKNARAAAKEFAENAGVKVGGIRSARQGSFIIRDVGEQYGDTLKIEKDVRVVTTITFYLID